MQKPRARVFPRASFFEAFLRRVGFGSKTMVLLSKTLLFQHRRGSLFIENVRKLMGRLKAAIGAARTARVPLDQPWGAQWGRRATLWASPRLLFAITFSMSVFISVWLHFFNNFVLIWAPLGSKMGPKIDLRVARLRKGRPSKTFVLPR